MNLVTLDFETYYDKEYSLSKMTTSEYIQDKRFRVLGVAVKINEHPAVWIEGKDVAAFFDTYAERIASSAVLMHHAQFDGAIMEWKYGVTPLLYLDTMAIGRALHGVSVGGSLAALLRHYNLGEKAPLSPDSTPEELKLRGTIDAEKTFELFKVMGKGFPTDELKLIDHTVRMFTQPQFEADQNMLRKLVNKLALEKKTLLEDAGVDKGILMSNLKLAELLTNLGVEPPIKVNKKGKEIYAFAKSDKGFQELLDHESPLVQAVAAARLGVKSTGDESRARRYLAMAQHGKLPVYLSYYAAHTGRWGGGDKTNFQNLRRGGAIRASLQAPLGMVLVVGDLSQIEARITFWLAGQENALQAFRDRRDIYCEFISPIYNRPISKADKIERFVGKTGVLGLGFGCGDERFRAEVRSKGAVEISSQLAQKVVDTFRGTYSNVPKLWERMATLLTGDRALGPVHSVNNQIILPNGLKIEYPELRHSGRAWRYKSRAGWKKLWGGSITENVVQALARIIIGDMILKLGARHKIVTLTHDEIVLCVLASDAVAVSKEMEDVMSTAQNWYADLPIACEVGVGINYGETK